MIGPGVILLPSWVWRAEGRPEDRLWVSSVSVDRSKGEPVRNLPVATTQGTHRKGLRGRAPESGVQGAKMKGVVRRVRFRESDSGLSHASFHESALEGDGGERRATSRGDVSFWDLDWGRDREGREKTGEWRRRSGSRGPGTGVGGPPCSLHLWCPLLEERPGQKPGAVEVAGSTSLVMEVAEGLAPLSLRPPPRLGIELWPQQSGHLEEGALLLEGAVAC